MGKTLNDMLLEELGYVEPNSEMEDQANKEQIETIKLVIKKWITGVDLSSCLSEEKVRQLLVILVDEP